MNRFIWSIYHVKFNVAIFLSFLLVLVASMFIVEGYFNFNSYKKHVEVNLSLTIDRLHFFIKSNVLSEKIKFFASPDKQSYLDSFYIHVNQDDIEKLNKDLPESGKEKYIDGYMKINDEHYKIKLRYRGNNPFHWLYAQKSLRIKLDNKRLYKMENTFNLINPPHEFSIIDTISYSMARELGLISPKFHHVKVYMNDKYSGVYIYLSQTDESLLRSYKRMPGSIYSGDVASTGMKDGTSALWFDSMHWDKKSSRNAEQRADRADIKFFINMINRSNNIEFYQFVNTFLDKDKLYTYIALDTLFGTNHHDYAHNHKYYFDPYIGKFEPIEWDPRFWTSNNKNKDLSVYKLLDRIRLNPILENERDRIGYEILQKYPVENMFRKLVIEKERIIDDLKADKYRDIAVRVPLFKDWVAKPMEINSFENMVNNFKNILEVRQKFLEKEYDKSYITYSVKKIEENIFEILLKVDGNSGIEINFDNLLVETRKNIPYNLFKYGYTEEIIKLQSLFPGRKVEEGALNNWPIWFVSANHIETAPLYYKFLLHGKVSFKKGTVEVINLVTNKKVNIHYADHLSEIKQSNSIHPWVLPIQKYKTQVLKDIIHVNQTLIFDKYTTVIIEPNTTFLMDQNISIYFYGKVTALGTKESPIKFIAKNPNKPWGLVAVQGKATTGSKFEYVEFENGSIDTRNLIHYTSPFNIHDTDWFEVRHCRIGRNFVGDDAMHIAYAKGIVDSCEFIDARADALDIDISDVTVTNNIFYKSGNDGLDIMTTIMDASNNVFIDIGDKGISVGEWSEANITDSFFLRTVIGTEVKDKSKVRANNLVYVDSTEKAINLYNKNKRYDEGGFLDAGTIYLLGNTKVKADKHSGQKIKHLVENTLPDLKQYKWYINLQNTPYKKFVEEVET